MINTLDWYIGRTLLGTSALSLLVLAGLSSLFRFIEQLKYVGQGDYQTLDAILFVLFSMPRDVEVFFPMAALLGGLIGMGMLASNSELVVMQASGLSRFNIIVSAIKSCLLMAVVVMIVGEWVAPASETTAKEIRTRAISGGSLFSGDRGSWAKDGNDFVHIERVEDKNNLIKIEVYGFDDQRNLKSIVRADSAAYNGDHWLMKNVEVTDFEQPQLQLSKSAALLWESSLTPDKLVTETVKPEALSVRGLMSYLDYLDANQQDSSRYQLAFWRKILQPLTVIVMLLLAMSFIFGPLRSVTMGARVLLGVVIGFGFHITNQIFGPISLVYQLPPFVGALLPSVVFILAALYLLNRKTG